MIAYLNNNKIRNIHFHQNGGGSASGANLDFGQIGYNETPSYLQNDFDYAKQIYDNWDASKTSMRNAFSGDTKLVWFPNVDTSNVSNMSYAFYSCRKLRYIPNNLNASNVTNMSYIFYYCSSLSLLDLSGWNVKNVTNMDRAFDGCTGLTSLDLSNWDTSNVTSASSMLTNCTGLTIINFPDSAFPLVGGMIVVTDGSPYRNSMLRVLRWNNLGSGANNVSINLDESDVLGVDDTEHPNARTMLTNTFVTNSFDRASAGYSACTLRFSSNTKALFTTEEIAQITNKGFTIA